MRKKRKRKIYGGVTSSRHLRAYAATLMPGTSLYSLQQAEPLLHRAFCIEHSIDIQDDEILNSSPSASTYRNMISDGAARCLHENITALKRNPIVWLTADKGTEKKKGKKYAIMPKLLCFYDPDSKIVREITLDVGSSGGTSAEAAKAIKHSIERLLNLDDQLSLTIMGVATDSGGGGTLSSLLRALRAVFADSNNVTISDMAEVISCSLHNVQTCLRNGILAVFGDSGTTCDEHGHHTTFKKNALQLIYGIANVHDYLDRYLFEAMWNVCCDKLNVVKRFSKMNKPCLSRWWTVGAAVVNLTESWHIWRYVFHHMVNLGSSILPSSVIDIAKSCVELIESNEIRGDCLFMLSPVH